MHIHKNKIETIIADLRKKKELDKESSHAYNDAIEQLELLLLNTKKPVKPKKITTVNLEGNGPMNELIKENKKVLRWLNSLK